MYGWDYLLYIKSIEFLMKIRYTMTGTMWVICPVISKAITDTDIEWVTAPANAAAPTTA